jgi:tetratricopeptide (TPR) repeat protein
MEVQGKIGRRTELMSSMKIRTHALGKKHPHVRRRLSNLMYQAQSRYGQTKTLVEVMVGLEKVLSVLKYHASVARRLHSLAALYMKQDEYEYAVALYTKALEISEKSLGEKHPGTVKIRRAYCAAVNYQAIQVLNQERRGLEQLDLITDLSSKIPESPSS